MTPVLLLCISLCIELFIPNSFLPLFPLKIFSTFTPVSLKILLTRIGNDKKHISEPMTTFKFLLHRSTRGDTYQGSINVRIIHERRVKVTSTRIKLYPHEWDQERQEIILPQEESDRYDYLYQMTRKLNKFRREFEKTMEQFGKKENYTLSDIAERNPAPLKITTLLGFIEDQAHKLTELDQYRTAAAYRSAGRQLIGFNKGKNLPLKDIDIILIKAFESHLRESGKALNTISYYMRMLRAIYNRSIADGVIKARRYDPFARVFTGTDTATDRNPAPGSDPLSLLQNLPFSSLLEYKKTVVATFKNRQFVLNPLDNTLHEKNLYDCWRYFFFCYHAGISFCDMAYLGKENIRQGVITYYRKDTEHRIIIPVSPILKKLIDSFSSEVKNTPYLFPIILHGYKRAATQYHKALNLHNKQLKRLALLAGISEDLSASL